jgi:predicted GIY-YIG superfamily endonuclease
VKIEYTEEFATLGDARKRENQIKRWSRAKKGALIAGNCAKLHALAVRRKY